MITLSLLIIFLGFWISYQTSERAELKSPNFFEKWIRARRDTGKVLGALVLLAGLILCVLIMGVAAGIFTFFIMLTVVASLTVMLGPLGFMNMKNVVLMVLFWFILEISF